MKFKIITLIAGIYLLASCSGSDQGIKLSDSAENTAYVEYLFCKNGPDMSQENFTGMIAYWNDIQDGMKNPVPMSVALQPRTATDFQGVSSNATERGKIVLIVGPTFGITFKTPAINALAITNFIPNKYSPIEASIATHIELSTTPVIQLLKALPHFNKILLARLL